MLLFSWLFFSYHNSYDSSPSLHVSTVNSFLLLSCIPLCIYTTICLVGHLMNIQVCNLGLLQINLLYITFVYVFVQIHVFIFLQ